ncbi:MAG: ABC transporter permease [Candidatus Competibacteraceae bacterium]|nr:ABC transporter permease [Candidatus Competibacteraceae bacterium]
MNKERKNIGSKVRIKVRDWASIWGVSWILLCAFVSLFAYVIAPDHSPNADQQFPELSLQSPGFNAQFLVTHDSVSSSVGNLSQWLFGKPVKQNWIALSEVQMNQSQPYVITAAYHDTIFQPQGIIRNRTFWLGTDALGRDVLSRVIIGTRISFTIGLVAVIISVITGVFIGAIAGYFRSFIDAMLSWLMNVFWSIPTLLLVLIFAIAMGKGTAVVFVAVGLTMWVDVARIVRGQMLSLREKEFAEAGRALGFTHLRILFVHLLPNTFPSVLVIAASNFASAILVESGLSFLGFGVQPPVPAWGSMIESHKNYLITGMPWLTLLPGICIMLMVLAFTFAGNGLKNRLKGK